MTDCIKIISFNLRADFKRDKLNRWDFRKEYAMKLIKESGATIIGVQELLPKMRTDVQNLLSNYTVLGWGRYKGAKPGSDEHSDIIIKNDDADVDFYKTFWLSNKTEDDVSRAYYSFFPRICTVAEVYVKSLNRNIRVFNTHFDHICGMARVLGVNIILRTMSELNEKKPMPTILMGDMNAHPKSRPIRILRENHHPYDNVHLTDVYSFCQPNSIKNTHHGFKQKGLLAWLTGRTPIDYIFVSDEFEILDVYVDRSNENGRFPSDHFPIVATLKLSTDTL
ncbi:endonuclease/exonuclease/phosphatase family protein [Hydrogenoanaerobacterium sp.]|uniref:endonuclease/exonuclease/phosphatase family protein n=1 Tax=Hydrogenoanaerobacterium sp. TaxID=2953763 RepID=UPI0028A102BA|nr:endonuclease/exonuclease/phosphatase family protein [Hydrogenoanaerobacterium sp.]